MECACNDWSVNYHSPLNDFQLRVLHWIADGCPPGVMQGHSHKSSAVALQSRGLVKILKTSDSWNAEITPEGKFYLKNGLYRRPRTNTKNGKSGNVKPVGKAKTSSGTNPAPTKDAIPNMGELSPEGLVKALKASNGILALQLDSQGRRRATSLTNRIIREDLAPLGQVIVRHLDRESGITYIALVDQPNWMSYPRPTSKFSKRLDAPFTFELEKMLSRPRPEAVYRIHNDALLVLSNIKREAVSRGHKFEFFKVEEPQSDYAFSPIMYKARLVINYSTYSLDFSGLIKPANTHRRGRPPSHSEKSGLVNYLRGDASGVVRVVLRGGPAVSIATWTVPDMKDIDIEPLLRELELRAAYQDNDWLNAALKAKIADSPAGYGSIGVTETSSPQLSTSQEDFRIRNIARLEDELSRWRKAVEIDGYLAALDHDLSSRTMSKDERLSAEKWRFWIASYRDQIDPLRGEVRITDPDD